MSISVIPISITSFSMISTVENLTIGIFEAAWTNQQTADKNRRIICNGFANLPDDLPDLYHITVNGSDEAEDFVIDKLHSTSLPAIAVFSRGGVVEHDFVLSSDGSFSSDLLLLILDRVKNASLRSVRSNIPPMVNSETLRTSLISEASAPSEDINLTTVVSQIFQQTNQTRNGSSTLHDMEVVDDDPQMLQPHTLISTGHAIEGGSVAEFQTLKLFLSGDKSSVGKSSTCLAILASLVRLGVQPSSIAYIKPVTQCEAEQPVTEYCSRMGIAHCGVGPVVFYKGFTRAYLMGETPSAEELLKTAVDAVDKISHGKRIVIVDGVGYPGVGSICNLSNAHIAKALDCPVLLVGKAGVGDAVDSFNMNARFFESYGVRVLGAVFNKIPLDGFYSVTACREAVTSYFSQYGQKYRPYGFIPLLPPRRENETVGEDSVSAMHVEEDVLQSLPVTTPVPLSATASPPVASFISDNTLVTDLHPDPHSQTVPVPSVHTGNTSSSTSSSSSSSSSSSPSEVLLVDAFLEHVDFGLLLYDVFKFYITSKSVKLLSINRNHPNMDADHLSHLLSKATTDTFGVLSSNGKNVPSLATINESSTKRDLESNSLPSTERTNPSRQFKYQKVDDGSKVPRESPSTSLLSIGAASSGSAEVVTRMGSRSALQRSREDIEALAYSQGAKKGG